MSANEEYDLEVYVYGDRGHLGMQRLSRFIGATPGVRFALLENTVSALVSRASSGRR